MKLKRLREVLNKIEDKDYEVETEESPSRGEDNMGVEHRLVIFDKTKERIIIKLNLNRNQVYYSNGRGRKFVGI